MAMASIAPSRLYAIICTMLHSDIHTRTLALNFYRPVINALKRISCWYLSSFPPSSSLCVHIICNGAQNI